MLSVRQKIERVEGLLGTNDLNEWEANFVESLARKYQDKNPSPLSDRQVETLDRIFGKHFSDMLTILDSNGIQDCLWCARATYGHNSFWRHLAVDFAEDVRHLMSDDRSINALVVARRHALGLANDDDLIAARYAALGAARYAARAAAWAARAAARAALAAAWDAARAAAWDAARAAEQQKQTDILRAALSDPEAYLARKREEYERVAA